MIPPPAYVAQIWLTQGGLSVHFPQANDGRGHTIALPADFYGLTCLLQILQERLRDGPYTVGHPSTPTQWQIERDIQRLQPDKTKKLVQKRFTTRDEREILRRDQQMERLRTQRRREAAALLAELGMEGPQAKAGDPARAGAGDPSQ